MALGGHLPGTKGMSFKGENAGTGVVHHGQTFIPTVL